jgi:hypothetical protein
VPREQVGCTVSSVRGMREYHAWPKIVFLFGAGASYLTGGLSRPPLLSGLLNPLQTAFPNSWGTIPDHSKAAFERDFEAAMDTYASESDLLVELIKDAALFFSGFKPEGEGKEPYYQLLARYRDLLISGEMLISTLNYDCLIELSGQQIELRTDYFRAGAGMRVLKLHGSSNFTVRPHNIKIGGKVTIGKGGRADFPIDDPPPDPSEVPNVLAICKFPPAMALMTPGKEILSGQSQILRLQNEFGRAVYKARFVVVIGANPNFDDKHVWNPIIGAPGNVGYIGSMDRFTRLEHNRKLGKTHWLGARFQESLDALFRFVEKTK